MHPRYSDDEFLSQGITIDIVHVAALDILFLGRTVHNEHVQQFHDQRGYAQARCPDDFPPRATFTTNHNC